MADFTDQDKVERGNAQYFDEGIHEVRVGTVVFSETSDGKEVCDVTVFGTEDEDAREAKARFWFNTDGGRSYAFGQIRNMVIHNTPEAKKEEVRKKFNAIKNTTELDNAMQKLLVQQSAQVWLQVVQNGTYERDGQTKPNYDRNIFGYKPTPKKTTTTPAANNTQPISTTDENGDEQVTADF